MKTIEKAAAQHAEKYSDDPHYIGYDAFKAGVEFAQHWILFDDERPQQFEQVLVRCKGKGDRIYLSEYLGYGSGSFTDTSSTVTHWRPIELK